MTKARKPEPAAAKPKPTPVQNPATIKHDYRVVGDVAWVAGRRVSEGDILRLTESEARYEPVEPVIVSTAAEKAADSE